MCILYIYMIYNIFSKKSKSKSKLKFMSKRPKKKKKKLQKTHSSTVYKCGLRRMQQIGVLLMFLRIKFTSTSSPNSSFGPLLNSFSNKVR